MCIWFPGVGLVGEGGSFVYCLCKFNVCRAASCDGFGYSGSPAQDFFTGCYITICIVCFPMHNKFLLLLFV